jgi:hypothetical protein
MTGWPPREHAAGSVDGATTSLPYVSVPMFLTGRFAVLAGGVNQRLDHATGLDLHDPRRPVRGEIGG